MTSPESDEAIYDVIVVGGGNAGLCAALSAAQVGARVLLLESAPFEERGGNSFFTDGLFRFAYRDKREIAALVPDVSEDEIGTIDVGEYPESSFLDDIIRLSEGMADSDLARVLVSQSYPTARWLQELGLRWALALGRQAFRVDGKPRFWGGLICEVVGGGAGLIEQLFHLAERRGVECRYEHRALRLRTEHEVGGRVVGVVAQTPDGARAFEAPAVVLAAGGFEANAEMRARYLGQDWDLVKVRGTRYNTGDAISMALAIGAEPCGHWTSCHAVAWDLGAPDYGRHSGANTFTRNSYQFGIVVNANGQRFIDEGADFRNYTYAKYGREILRQPQRLAFQIFDAEVEHLLRDEYRLRNATRVAANTIEELSEELMIDPDRLRRTVAEFNAACNDASFDPTRLDGKAALGVTPPKSNWAVPLTTPPFIAYPVTCGITFTFGGLRIDTTGAVIATNGLPIPGLYAAGELVGGLFYNNYPGGSGLTSGAVFGRLSGRTAAQRQTGHPRKLRGASEALHA